jgi:hypothetical protein
MTRHAAGILLLVVASLSAGCFERAGPSGEGPTSSDAPTASMTTSSASTSTPGPDNSTKADPELIQTGCTSWRIVRQFYGTGSPGTRPPGWEPADATAVITGIEVYGFNCQRVSVGPFERGPVQMVLEMHTNVSFPAACLEGADPFVIPAVLQSIWVNDAEIAGYLRQEYGMPTFFADIQQEDTSLQAVNAHEVSWGEPGQPASVLTTVDDAEDRTGDSLPYRLAWPVGSAVWLLDYVPSLDDPFLFQRVTAGKFEQPMLLAGVDGGQYAGNGAWYDRFEATARVLAFADGRCAQPA